MCFSQPASFGFAAVAFGTAALLRRRGQPLHRVQLFAWFGLMEVIQFLAYFVVDQCDSRINQALTLAAFAHVSFQNVSVNWFFLSQPHIQAQTRRLVLGMCVIGGAIAWLAMLPIPVWLGAPDTLLDGLAAVLPEVRSLRQAGTIEACRFESMCGPQVCTFSTPNHIAWSLPLMPPSYYRPNSFLHFFFFFTPTMLLGRAWARATLLAALATGPLLTQLLAARHPATYAFEWPATWCYLSVSQCFIGLAAELLAMRREQQQAGKPGPAAAAANGRVHVNGSGSAGGVRCRKAAPAP